jgi:hypothetical protein
MGDVTFSGDDVQFVRDEIDRLEGTYRHAEFVERCRRGSARLIVNWTDGGEFVAETAIARLTERLPFSMVRLGDGEGNILSLMDPAADLARELKWFNASFYEHASHQLDAPTARLFAETMEDAFCNADVIGVREFPVFDDTYSELKCARDSLPISIRGSLGMIRARQSFLSMLSAGRLASAVVTSAWVYFTLLEHLISIIAAAEKVIVINGRIELIRKFENRFGAKAQFVPIPLAGHSDPVRGRPFPEAYAYVHSLLSSQDLTGKLILVGAGIFAKSYCQAAKKAGGVALDIGSGFDILAGIKTRPIHQDSGFDLEAMRWI